MPEYMYSAWFRDEKFAPNDQDYEWVAMFIVVAANEKDARIWGDQLAQRHASVIGEPFIASYVESASEYEGCVDYDKTPRVVAGDDSLNPFVSGTAQD